jgi:hypothetical protein
MQITLVFPHQQGALPSREEHLGDLWKVARLFEPLRFKIDAWYPAASTVKKSLANPAFDCRGPTSAALEMLRAQDERDKMPYYRIASIWNGATKGRSAVFSTSLSSDAHFPNCVFRLQLDDVAELDDIRTMQQFMHGLLTIWLGASLMEVGPTAYYTTEKVFPQRPGAGWMLYLPTPIATKQLPEAAELLPVMEGFEQKGTIIVSVPDTTFSVDNRDHVATANAIEVRLADQDLLPAY